MVILMLAYIYYSSPSDPYIRFGPHDDTMLMGLKIDTREKYIVSMVFLNTFTAFQSCREVIVYPWIMHKIYNKDCIDIQEFSRREVNFIANGNYASDRIWYMVGIWMVVSQIDFAFMAGVSACISNYFVIRSYLNTKNFDRLLASERLLQT